MQRFIALLYMVPCVSVLALKYRSILYLQYETCAIAQSVPHEKKNPYIVLWTYTLLLLYKDNPPPTVSGV